MGGDDATGHIIDASRRKRDDDPHRLRRIILGRGRAGQCRHDAANDGEKREQSGHCIPPG